MPLRVQYELSTGLGRAGCGGVGGGGGTVLVFLVLRVLWAQSLTRDSLKDDDLAGRMGLQLKELNKVMVVLEKDQLIKVYVSLHFWSSFR